MITKCTAADLETILDFIGDDYCRCLYLYLDLLQYGFDTPFVSVWRQNDSNGGIAAVWLKYYSGMHVYAPAGYSDVQEALALVRSERPAVLCGVPETLSPLMGLMAGEDYEYQEGTVCRYAKRPDSVERIVPRLVERREDFLRIGEMLSGDPEYGASYSPQELADQLQERFMRGLGRSFAVDREGQIAAHGCVAAECERFALLSGGITDPAWRQEKLGTKLLLAIADGLKKSGKATYSLYYNPITAALHHKTGFEDCCAWGKMILKRWR
jgi:hypothetical protein